MRVSSSIEDPSIVHAILEHLGLWLARFRPPPKVHDPPVCIHNAGRRPAPPIPDDIHQIPIHDDHFQGDSHYSWDDYTEA